MSRRLGTIGLILLVFCLGIQFARAEGVGINYDSLKAIRLLKLSATASDQKEAISFAISSLSIGMRINNHSIVAKSYRQLASFYRNVRAPQLFHLDSQAVYHAAKARDNSLYFDALQLIAKDFLNSNQTKKAARYLPLLDSLAALSNRSYDLCVASQLQSFYYYKIFQPAQALAFSRKSLTYAMKGSDRLLQLRQLSQLGQNFQNLMKPDSAAIYLYQALDLARQVGDKFELANVQSSLGLLYQMSGDQQRSIRFYRESIHGFREAGQPIETSYTLLALSDVYRQLGNEDSVYASVANAIRELKLIQYKTGLTLAHNYMGRYFSRQNENDSAQYHFNLAKSFSKNNTSELLDFITKSYEAIAQYELGEHASGDELLRKELARIGKLIPAEIINSTVDKVSIPGLSDSMKQNVKGLLLRGDTVVLKNIDSSVSRSINPYTGTLADLDSLVAIRQHEAITRIDAQFRVRETRDSLLLARREQQIASQKISLRNQALVFTGLLLVALLFLLYLQRRHNKTVRLLKEEADHRITNTLNNISSIIENVKTESTDHSSFDLLEERVAPLMVLYEVLSSGTNRNVDMQSYFQIICEGRKLSYDHQNRIAVEVNASVTMSGKTAGRVGLIVNELVTNAFKHAFTQQDSGRIVINCRLISSSRYYLSIEDNGTGNVLRHTTGRGLQQVKELAWEIGATMNLRTDHGAMFEFYFPKT